MTGPGDIPGGSDGIVPPATVACSFGGQGQPNGVRGVSLTSLSSVPWAMNRE